MDLAGLTQADLARAAGCHPRSVRYWENKGRNPPTNVASIQPPSVPRITEVILLNPRMEMPLKRTPTRSPAWLSPFLSDPILFGFALDRRSRWVLRLNPML